jgi:glutamine synthetase
MSNSWDLLFSAKPATGADGGGGELGTKNTYEDCVVAEYVWLDAHGVPRSKTKTLSKAPTKIDDLPMWNFDGSSTEQAPGEDSEILLLPRALFKDPFRQGNNVLVLAECVTPDMQPAIGNSRAACVQVMQKYDELEAWFGIEQEYTLMAPTKVGEKSSTPYGFNADGSEPAAQGPYYCGAGTGMAIGRTVADTHYAKCLYAGVKVAGINAEVMPGQWEYQVGPCRGIQMGDHLIMSRYIMYRVTEDLGVQVTFDPKPREGDWNGAGCHTNFSTHHMRAEGGYEAIEKVCKAFGNVSKEHIAEYGEGNEKRLTGLHETCSINDFKYGVADRGASIRIPRETFLNNRGYMEDRRPAANCDPYKVTRRMVLTTGECLMGKPLPM